jgi:hypothetical protein
LSTCDNCRVWKVRCLSELSSIVVSMPMYADQSQRLIRKMRVVYYAAYALSFPLLSQLNVAFSSLLRRRNEDWDAVSPPRKRGNLMH